VPVAEAIDQINNGIIIYFTVVDGALARVLTVDGPTGRYLRTEADTTGQNNLDMLPDC
jgi:hypothetical protein